MRRESRIDVSILEKRSHKQENNNDTYNTAVDVDASIQSRCHIGRTTIPTCFDKIVLSVEKRGRVDQQDRG